MADSSEGVRRLSLFAGGIGSFLWLAYVLTEVSDWNVFGLRDLSIVVCGLVFFFLIPFAFVRGVAWVIQGFARKKD
jgi:hypothetical protein